MLTYIFRLRIFTLKSVNMFKLISLFSVLFLSTTLSAQVYINELMAGNQIGIQDDFFQNEDWVELHNTGGIVNLAGYYLTDNPENLTKWLIPNTNAGLTTVLPGGFLLFWMDNDTGQGEDHAGFKLSTDGDEVLLVNPDGITIIDQIAFGTQQHDISYGRSCDGCPEWEYFNLSTPEASNVQTDPVSELLYINEVMSNNASYIQDEADEYEHWIEIFNPNPFQINLAGYKIQTEAGTYEVLATSPFETTVPEESFILFWLDSQAEQGNAHVEGELLTSGGTVSFIGPDDAVVDTYSYPALGENDSWGRQIDAGANSMTFTIATPRVTNSLFIIQPEEVYINELMTSNSSDTTDTANEFEDWFEIYNPNLTEVNLAGYWLTDNPANPMKYQVPLDRPDSTIIEAGGYLLFYADEQQGEGWNHVNFRLSNMGESLSLLSPDGFTLADEIEFGALQSDTSYGRYTDGSPDWVLFTETTPEYSNNGATINVNEQDDELVLTVYPNPVRSGMLVNLDKQRDWELFNMNGQKLNEGQLDSYISTANLNSGMYLIVLDKKYYVKLLVQN
jgi:hypothetical protein